MRVTHEYELCSLAKSLKKSLNLSASHSQILESLALAAGQASYGHMKASFGPELLGPEVEAFCPPAFSLGPFEVRVSNSCVDSGGSEFCLASYFRVADGARVLVKQTHTPYVPDQKTHRDEIFGFLPGSPVEASAWTDCRTIEQSLDGRLFLLFERAEVVLAALFCETFDGGRDFPTDQIAMSSLYEQEMAPLFSYLNAIRSNSSHCEQGFEATIDSGQSWRYLSEHRPDVLLGQERLFLVVSDARAQLEAFFLGSKSSALPKNFSFGDLSPKERSDFLLRLAS